MPLAFSILSCSRSATDVAIKWTNDIKAKVLEDASRTPDKTVYDSAHRMLTTFKDGKKLKECYFAKRENHDETQPPVYDTGMIVWYSADQNFQFIRMPCTPRTDRTFEGVAYKGNRYGFAEYQYCKKAIRETGFIFNNFNVGTWTQYDSAGQVVEAKDVGDAEKLRSVEDIHYSR